MFHCWNRTTVMTFNKHETHYRSSFSTVQRAERCSTGSWIKVTTPSETPATWFARCWRLWPISTPCRLFTETWRWHVRNSCMAEADKALLVWRQLTNQVIKLWLLYNVDFKPGEYPGKSVTSWKYNEQIVTLKIHLQTIITTSSARLCSMTLISLQKKRWMSYDHYLVAKVLLFSLFNYLSSLTCINLRA